MSHSAAVAPGISEIGLMIFISFVKHFEICSFWRVRNKAVQLMLGKKKPTLRCPRPE